jgi:hypothetical protein
LDRDIKEKVLWFNVKWVEDNAMKFTYKRVFSLCVYSCVLLFAVYAIHCWGVPWGDHVHHTVLMSVFWHMILPLAMLMLVVTIILLFFPVRHRYQFVGWHDNQSDPTFGDDLRTDATSLGELKHNKPLIALVKHTEVTHIFGKTNAGYSSWHKGLLSIFSLELPGKTTIFPVSMEVLSQITGAVNLRMSSTPLAAWERIEMSAKSLHSVNVSRYLVFEGAHPVQGACLVAFGLFMQMRERLRNVPFPIASSH